METSDSRELLEELDRARLFEHLNEADLKAQKISPSEFQQIVGILERAPTLAEIGVFSAMWSEHCSYKSSRLHLKRLPSEGSQVAVGPGENAGVVRLQNKLCVAFKMESHNHPSFIEPYQGAATGVGGILRDVFCMGARPIANLNALRFGDRKHPKTPWLVDGVVRGIGDYGNCVGVPTVGGSLDFDSSYNGNILVNAMTIGLIDEDAIFKGFASGVGNLVVYVGSATGRDGIHGATMASTSFASENQSDRSAIQVGDPFCEKLLLEATLEALDAKLVVGIQDMGAAGLTSSLFEMAERAQSGLSINLDEVPVRSTGMSAQDLLLSESQERMAMVIQPENWPSLRRIFEKWQLEHNIIGKVTDSGRVVATYQNKLEVDVPIAPLVANAPCYDRPRQERQRDSKLDQQFSSRCSNAIDAIDKETLLKQFVSELAFKEPIYSQFDYQVGNQTNLGPSSEGAAVLWISPSRYSQDDSSFPPYLGLAANAGCLENYCRIDAKKGAAHTVAKLARGIIACGAEPLAVTDCLNYGNPDDPQVMADISDGIDGLAEACKALKTPVVSGNVSLYNETDGDSIAPTPMIGMIGKVSDIRLAVPAVPKNESSLFLLSPKSQDFCSLAASLIAKCCQLPTDIGVLPRLDWDVETEAARAVRELGKMKSISAIRDLGRGGIMAGCLKMAFGADLSLTVQMPFSADLFSEQSASYLIALEGEPSFLDKRALTLELSHCKLAKIGDLKRTEHNFIAVSEQIFSWEELKQRYRQYL